MGKPSSIIKEAARAIGRAPAVSRSVTVPATASRPMSPPGKNRGSTTKASVVKAISGALDLQDGTVVGRKSLGAIAARKTRRINSPISRPPAP